MDGAISIFMAGDNFFQYACGAWNKKNMIPEDKSSFSTFEVNNINSSFRFVAVRLFINKLIPNGNKKMS